MHTERVHPGAGDRSWTIFECHSGTWSSPSLVGHEDLILKLGTVPSPCRDTLATHTANRAAKNVFVLPLTGWVLNCRLGEEPYFSECCRTLEARGRGLWSWTVTDRSLFSYCRVWNSTSFSWTSHGPLHMWWNISWPTSQVIVLSLNLEACAPSFTGSQVFTGMFAVGNSEVVQAKLCEIGSPFSFHLQNALAPKAILSQGILTRFLRTRA